MKYGTDSLAVEGQHAFKQGSGILQTNRCLLIGRSEKKKNGTRKDHLNGYSNANSKGIWAIKMSEFISSNFLKISLPD